MGKHTISMKLSTDSITAAIKELKSYQSELTGKCERIVSELAKEGITIGRQNTGKFGSYIVFSMNTTTETAGCTAIMLARETGTITRQWKLADDSIKSVQISPLLMAEFGSGKWAENPTGVSGVGQGTFPGQTHAFDASGWSWKDLDGNWHHSTGMSPTAPMYKAAMKMEQIARAKVREVFG